VSELDETVRLRLDWFELRVSEDPVKVDLEVVCTECDEVVCDAESGDTVATLVSVAMGHHCKV
jgi:hypothetical protein